MTTKVESINLPWASLTDHRHMHVSPEEPTALQKRERLHQTVLRTVHVPDQSSLDIITLR